MKKGILAFDIDGTLTPRLDWIDPKIVQYLEEKSKEGWIIALITGRIFSFAREIFQRLTFPYVLAVQNGADILEMPEKKHISRNYFGGDIVEKLKTAYETEEEDFVIYAGVDQGDFAYFRKNRFSPKMLEYTSILSTLGERPWKESDFQFPKEMTFPLVKCFGKKESMRKLYKKLQNIPDIEVSIIQDPVDTSLYLNLITHPKANKGSALNFLRKHFSADFAIAAGDQHNDLKMLQEADLRVVIDTAPKEMLALADIIAKPPEELGIIDAIEEAISHASR